MRNFLCGSMAVLLLSSLPARALPVLGTPVPAADLEPAEGQPRALAAAIGRPALIVYESRDCKDQNLAFKQKLKALAQSNDAYRAQVALFPVADLEGLAFWPIKGFVERAVRGESKRIGWMIYCDWDGALRRKLGLSRDLSSVILVDRAGRVVFAQEGPLSEPDQALLIDLLRQEISA